MSSAYQEEKNILSPEIESVPKSPVLNKATKITLSSIGFPIYLVTVSQFIASQPKPFILSNFQHL